MSRIRIVAGERLQTCVNNSMPSISGMRWSLTITSIGCAAMISSASRPDVAVNTSYSLRNIVRSRLTTRSSSSTNSNFAFSVMVFLR